MNRPAEKPKATIPKPRPIIRISSATGGTSVGTSSVAEEEIQVVDDPTQLLSVARVEKAKDKVVRKSKSATSVGVTGFSSATYADRESGKIAMRELEVRLKNWSGEAWRIGEEVRELREFIYKDYA